MTIAKNLIADENVLFEAQKHWVAPIRASGVAILMVLGALVLRWLSPDWDGLFSFVGSLFDLASVGLVIGGIAWIVYNVVAWRTAVFAVTNLRVMREEGLFKHRSSATMLTSLSDVRMNQSLIGKQLGFGDVIVYSQSGDAGVDRFRTITDPVEFRNAIMTEKTGKSGPAATATAVAPTPGPSGANPAVATPLAPAPPVAPTSDPATALASLADLRDRGAITNEEFEAKKAELLARM
jgi:uncharacterized membrane protein YdbT with pleckstrin-like domain